MCGVSLRALFIASGLVGAFEVRNAAVLGLQDYAPRYTRCTPSLAPSNLTRSSEVRPK